MRFCLVCVLYAGSDIPTNTTNDPVCGGKGGERLKLGREQKEVGVEVEWGRI